MKSFLLISAAVLVAAPVAASVMRDYLEASIQDWAHDPIPIDAITAQNETTKNFSQSLIDELDQTWRAEVGQVSLPLISDVLSNSASAYLRDQVTGSGGAISNVFAMDARGLNVATSDATSDYWQGDNGTGAVHSSEYDESASAHLGQVSFAITQPQSGEAIGALTIGPNTEALL